ncbi:hypothetical protein, partial [Mariniphaga sediminis]|uniref:hypothetical protein n=1 Tax=Mariniphaga sediminis TaxID=1628158 RepID=UPI00356209FC
MNDRKINVIKNRIKNKLPEYSAAYSLLLKEADNLLLVGAYSSGTLPRFSRKNNRVLDLKGRSGSL